MCYSKGKERNEQFLAVLWSVLDSSDGVDEATETGNGGVDLEYPTSHRLRRRPRRRTPLPTTLLNILKAHLIPLRFLFSLFFCWVVTYKYF